MHPHQVDLNSHDIVQWFVAQAVGLPADWKIRRGEALGGWEDSVIPFAFPYCPDQFQFLNEEGLQLLGTDETMDGVYPRQFQWAILRGYENDVVPFIKWNLGFTWNQAPTIGVFTCIDGSDAEEYISGWKMMLGKAIQLQPESRSLVSRIIFWIKGRGILSSTPIWRK